MKRMKYDLMSNEFISFNTEKIYLFNYSHTLNPEYE